MQENYNFSPKFFEVVKAAYHSESQKVDFINPEHEEKARKEINIWVEQKTKNKIKELIKPGILNVDRRLILVNAIYFNGKWAKKFDSSLTKEDDFDVSPEKKIKAKFMHVENHYNYYKDEEIQTIEIPYKDSIASMLVILPNEMQNLKTVEASLNPAYYKTIISSLQNKSVQLSLPKFKTTAEFKLNAVLSNMGMPLSFTPNADFSGMRADSLKDLFISDALHKAFVNVSEVGTEAAAATAIVMTTCSAPAPPLLFKVDHPFIFIIKDNATGSILFMGEIKDPTQE